MDALPLELQVQILGQLSVKDVLLNLGLSCKRYRNRILESGLLWRHFCFRFIHIESSPFIPKKGDWFTFFKLKVENIERAHWMLFKMVYHTFNNVTGYVLIFCLFLFLFLNSKGYIWFAFIASSASVAIPSTVTICQNAH